MWSRQRAAAASNSEAILRAAEELFALQGVGAVDMRQIARRADVGVGTVYRRFTDKAGLLSALLDAPERALQDQLIAGAPPLARAPARSTGSERSSTRSSR
jgi:AcrR family transcriptional regulator